MISHILRDLSSLPETNLFSDNKDKHNTFFVCPVKDGYSSNKYCDSLVFLLISIINISFPQATAISSLLILMILYIVPFLVFILFSYFISLYFTG